MISQVYGNQKKANAFISNKIDVKAKMIMRQRRPLYKTKGLKHQEDTTIINIYAPTFKHQNILRKY